MKRWAVAVLLVLGACGGGGSEFNEQAIRADLDARWAGDEEGLDAMVDSMRDLCEGDDTEFGYTVALAVDRSAQDVNDLLIACPKRTQAVLDELDG